METCLVKIPEFNDSQSGDQYGPWLTVKVEDTSALFAPSRRIFEDFMSQASNISPNFSR